MDHIESVTCEIDGDTFKLGPLTFTAATEQLPEIMAMIGPALGDLAAAAATQDIKDVKLEAILPVIPRLFAAAGGGKLMKLMKLFLHNTTMNGKPLVPAWDAALAGRVDVGFELLGRALWLNYHRVFTRLLARLKATGEPASASPST